MIDPTTGKRVRYGSPQKPQEVNLNFDNYKYREWEYQNPKNNIKPTILKGTSKKKVNYPNEREVKIFNNIKIHPQPNSKRILLCELLPNTNTKRSKKKVDVQAFSQENLKLFPEKKKIITNNAESNKEVNDSPYRRHLKSSMFQEYKKTQITTLPGPAGQVIRDLNKIKDDKNKESQIIENKNRSIYYMDKIKNDYCSNVACLPNSLNNDVKDKKLLRGRSYNNFYDDRNKNVNRNDNYRYNYLNSRSKHKIRRGNTKDNIHRPFSSNQYNSNNVNNFGYDYIGENYNNKKYRNVESYLSFDMMKPSSVFQKKYELRFKKF